MLRYTIFLRNGQSHIKSFLPLIIGQLRKTEYQVDADVRDSGIFQDGICFPCILGIVTAVHELEDSVIERLDAHADAVHSQAKQSCNIFLPFFNYVFRIDLDGKFVVRT